MFKLNKNDVSTLILDYLDIPSDKYKIKMNTSFYFDNDGYNLDGPNDVYAVEYEKPKLNENYYMIKKGQIGLVRNIKEDLKLFKDKNYKNIIKNEYNPEDYLNTPFKEGYIVLFSNSNYMLFENGWDLTNLYVNGKIDIYEKKK